MRLFAALDVRNNIVGLNTNNMIGNSGWIEITEEALTAHTNMTYFQIASKLVDDIGIFLYKYVDGFVDRRTQSEIDSDVELIPIFTPDKLSILTEENILLKAQIQALSDRGEFIEDCIAEMAMFVYE